MITQKAIDLLNYRIKEEETSSRLYEQLSLCLENLGYKNSPGIWKRYSEEEMEHARWSKEYLLSFGILPTLSNLESPYCNCQNLAEVIQETYKHEVMVTKQCNDLAEEAIKLKDHNLYSLAIRYCKEQIEEMNKVQDLMDKLETYGSDKLALVLLDKDLI